VLNDCPASQAGLTVDDHVVAIDADDVAGLRLGAINRLMTGALGTAVTLTVVDASRASRVVNLTRYAPPSTRSR
jgi:C-terminal processing protease CtpA/Prc